MDGVLGERVLAKVVATLLVGLVAAVMCRDLVAGEMPYRMVDELQAADEGRELRVHGWVLPGSIRQHSDAYVLVLQKSGKKLLVIGDGRVPEAVIDQSEIVVTGMYTSGVLQSVHSVKRCADTYRQVRNSDRFE